MCQQSLINYLTVKLDGKVKKEDIEILIKVGEHVTENEADALIKEKLIKKGEQKTATSRLALPESIRKNAKMIDQKCFLQVKIPHYCRNFSPRHRWGIFMLTPIVLTD